MEAQTEEERGRSDRLRASLDSTAKEMSQARETLAEAKGGLSITGEALQQAQVRRFSGSGLDRQALFIIVVVYGDFYQRRT